MINYYILDWLSIRIIGKNLTLSYDTCELCIESTKQQSHKGKCECAGLKIADHCRHLLLRSESVVAISACVCRWPSVKLDNVERLMNIEAYLLETAISVH